MGISEVRQELYVCIYVPEFPAQALMRLRPELTQSPVAVLAGDPPLQQVCSMNARALRLGVEHGMTRTELDSFTGLCVLRRSEIEEQSGRLVLLEAAGSYTPWMEVWPSAVPSFMVVLDMTGTTSIFGLPSEATTKIRQSLGGLSFFAQLSASANFHAAVCAAPSARKYPIVLTEGQERKFLCKLPLSSLNLTPHQADTLSLWGLNTLGDLAELPEEELIVRLGQEGKRLQLVARGEHSHQMVPVDTPFVLKEFLNLDSRVEQLDSLLFVLGPMLVQLLTRARQHALGIASLTAKLEIDGGAEHKLTIRPALPVVQCEVLLKLLYLKLQAQPPSAGIVSIQVHAEPGNLSRVQLGVFTPQLPEALRLDVTLARIAALVGESYVGRAKLTDTNSTDNFKIERFVVPQSTKVKPNRSPLRGAVRRYRPPIKVAVHHEDQQLASFSLQGKSYSVQELYGPWRMSGEWWSSCVWSREEWDVHASCQPDDALNCILVHDLLRNQWQLDALYD